MPWLENPNMPGTYEYYDTDDGSGSGGGGPGVLIPGPLPTPLSTSPPAMPRKQATGRMATH